MARKKKRMNRDIDHKRKIENVFVSQRKWLYPEFLFKKSYRYFSGFDREREKLFLQLERRNPSLLRHRCNSFLWLDWIFSWLIDFGRCKYRKSLWYIFMGILFKRTEATLNRIMQYIITFIKIRAPNRWCRVINSRWTTREMPPAYHR